MSDTNPSPVADIDGLVPLMELFDRDPLELTAENLDQIIEEFRRKRVEWEAEDKSAKASGRRANPNKGIKKTITKDEALSLDLGDLLGKPGE